MKKLKNNIWFWAFIALLVADVFALSTMFISLRDFDQRMDQIELATPPSQPSRGDGVGPRNRRANSGFMHKKMRNRLGFTNEQWEEIRDSRQKHQSNMREHQQKLRVLKREMVEIISQEKMDQDKVKKLRKEILSVHGAIIDESNSFYLKLKSISTPEQMKALNRLYHKKYRGKTPRNNTNNNPKNTTK